MNFLGFMLLLLLAILGLSESKSKAYCEAQRVSCHKKCPNLYRCHQDCNMSYSYCLNE